MEVKYFNDYNEAKKEARKKGLIEAEYGDTGRKYNRYDISYVCYNKTGEQNGDYNIVCYYTWERVGEAGRLTPCKLEEEAFKRVINY